MSAVLLAWLAAALALVGVAARAAPALALPSPAQRAAVGGTAGLGGVARAGGAAWAGGPVGAGGPGYWMGAADGGVFAFGGARFSGSAGGLRLAAPVVGLAATPTGRGYWEVAADGGVFTYGDARFSGSAAGLRLAAPVVSLGPTPTGLGYWMAAGDGGVFAFGDAPWYGAALGANGHGPMVALTPTPSGLGYWLVSAGGQIVALGNARWYGDAASVKLTGPAVAMASTPSGRGYWVVTSKGQVLAFGDARYLGSPAALPVVRPLVGIAATATGGGYWLVGADGAVFAYGDASYQGGLAGRRLAGPVVSMAPPPGRHGVGVATFYYPWYATTAQDGFVGHWNQGGHTPPDDIGSDYYPQRGAYSSTDPAVVDAQLAEIAVAGIDEIVSSWWGQGSFEDRALTGVLAAAAAHGVQVGIHLEPYVGRTPQTVASDVGYLRALGITHIWLYEAMLLPLGGVQAVNDTYPDDLHLAETGDIVAVRSGAFARWAAAAHFKAVYTYDAVRYEGADFPALCASSRAVGLGCVPAVAPGFISVRAGPGPFRSRDNGATYDRRWMGALGAHPDAVAITSYNEWHEGTQIEPAVQKCLSIIACYLTYDGAYGLTGPAAAMAYIERTRSWTAIYRAASPASSRP